ncbi:MAG: hypothetical protein RSC93_00150 [Erysipelotrichaceae bacterium]
MDIVNQNDVSVIVDTFFTTCNILNTYSKVIIEDVVFKDQCRTLFLMHILPFSPATVEAVDLIIELIELNPQLAKCFYKLVDTLQYENIINDMTNIQFAILNKTTPRYEIVI